ncbi:twitching motility protein PilT [Candidatus Daviesbacteria bacterium RIFCSPLOWO2_01_FULL_38_10]|uniref:Ribonuclease VapC n=1 Tax=Candidatus Daviesbacteria bacterium GW2011_GWF2_38_6 TaxID=1618432 RepID=A0A0G0KKV8_9BACT|nr:MAG: PilT protein domain protein [Candidatus Daviesbacteria bacterium GW2011_GWF2_38_6]OGE26380.1 MAG: twitching motility protein PilT [Candidatus Daviesbacteria bacterium RIFCSPHIGHO2_02_FULL_39_41]OGE39849.1 MAG: twitching motility protein PilT [Candidatus Daviesbacteria bacterium RIFCSPLOWO2_01_FULL_38_10]OGE45121.1 MAG: twitching motility protein PilT [Candidatus Daviesbacteria bacterium RIFCSPHIGHO2_12_FULL_38_25]OGE68542.1 MAG: twitching motility protein PilT [Candidatus Daviesbacteria
MKKIILDTNAYTGLLRGDEQILKELGNADNIFVPVIVIGELLAGFQGGTKETKNRQLLEQFLMKPRVEVVPIDKETAEIFGEIKYALVKAGTPLPVNDIWIACCALEAGAVIVSYDDHFLKIPQVRTWAPLDN